MYGVKTQSADGFGIRLSGFGLLSDFGFPLTGGRAKTTGVHAAGGHSPWRVASLAGLQAVDGEPKDGGRDADGSYA